MVCYHEPECCARSLDFIQGQGMNRNFYFIFLMVCLMSYELLDNCD